MDFGIISDLGNKEIATVGGFKILVSHVGLGVLWYYTSKKR